MILSMAVAVERAMGDGKWTAGFAGFKACGGTMSAGCRPCAPYLKAEKNWSGLAAAKASTMIGASLTKSPSLILYGRSGACSYGQFPPLLSVA